MCVVVDGHQGAANGTQHRQTLLLHYETSLSPSDVRSNFSFGVFRAVGETTFPFVNPNRP